MTEAEYLEEIAAALQRREHPDDAWTSTELADMLDLKPDAVRKRIRALKKLGRIEVVIKSVTGNDDRHYPVTAYRVLPG